MADVVLYVAVILVIVIVLMAIPRTRVANEETLAALHRQQTAHRPQHARALHGPTHDAPGHTPPPDVSHAA